MLVPPIDAFKLQFDVTDYDSLPQFKASDHQPVRAIVNVPSDVFKVKDQIEKRAKFWPLAD